MPRMYEFVLTRTANVSIVVPDDMTQEDIEKLVSKNFETLFTANADDDVDINDDYDISVEDAKEADFIVSDDGTDFSTVEEADWLEDLDEEIDEDEEGIEAPEW